jgi:hypothetical protein
MKTVILTLASGAGAWAQCSMCRTAAAAHGAAGGKTLDTAVLVLLLPAMALFCGVFLTAFRGGSRDDERRDG